MEKPKIELAWCFVDGCLTSNITKWLRDNHIEYEFGYNEDNCFLVFENANDAIQFKLTFVPEPISLEEEASRRLTFYLMKEIDKEIIQTILWTKENGNN